MTSAGEKRIDLSYPIKGKDGPEVANCQAGLHQQPQITVVSMLSDNVQYLLWGHLKVQLKSGEDIVLNKRVYMDKELNSLKGTELRMQMMDSGEDILKTNKLEKVTKIVISLNELDNSDNLKDGRPSNTLFTYYVTSPEYSMHFELCTPQYKALKNGMITSLTLAMTDQAGNIITDGPGTTVAA